MLRVYEQYESFTQSMTSPGLSSTFAILPLSMLWRRDRTGACSPRSTIDFVDSVPASVPSRNSRPPRSASASIGGSSSLLLLALLPRQLRPDIPKQLRIPPLADVLVALDAVAQGGLAEGPRRARAAAERELDIIPTAAGPLEHSAALLSDVGGHRADADGLELVERGVAAHALKKRDAEARAGPRGRAEYPVRRRHAHAARQRLHALADGHDQRAVPRRAVDPLAARVLDLQAAVRARLEQVARQHAVLVGADALPLPVSVCESELRRVRVPHHLELVLLAPAGVKVPVKGPRRQPDGLGDQRREGDADPPHGRHVLGERRSEPGEHGRRRPLVRREQVVM